MKENKLYEFDLAIYPRKLWVAVSKDTFSDILENVSEWNESAYACVDNVYDKEEDKGGMLIRFRDKKALSIKNITHESVHVALECFEYIGADIDYDNQEPFAYLVDYIAECCETVKKDKNNEQNGKIQKNSK